MSSIIWLLLLFALAVISAATFGANDGLVSLFWSDWRLDLSLNLFVAGLVITCLAIVLGIQALVTLVGLPRRARQWRMAQRERSSQAALREALAQYFAGRYSRAQKAAQRALAIQQDTPELAQDNDLTALGHLLTAGSLHRLQDRTRRDEELAKAMDLSQRQSAAKPVAEGARLLAAEWALEDRDAERALDLIGQLPPGVARRTQALRLRLQAARLARQPLEALRTARLLAKHQGFSKEAAQGLLRALAFESLDTARDIEQLRKVWGQFELGDRRDPIVAARASRTMSGFGAHEDARACLRPFWEELRALSREDRAALALALVPALPGLGAEWLPQLEDAVQRHPREPAVAFAVGCALAERQLWGKARRLLEQAAADPALETPARRLAWLGLADMSEKDGDAARASQCYQRAARLL